MRHGLGMPGVTAVSLAALTAFLSVSAGAAGRQEESRSDQGLAGRSVPPPSRLPEPVTPESHVPPRSPDLGRSVSPLTPSIGPGSRSLGPEAGREPAHPRPEAGAGSGDNSPLHLHR